MTQEHQDRIPAGRYLARCTGPDDVQFGYASSGNEQILLRFELLNEGFQGQYVQWFGSFANDQAQQITFRTLRDCGWQGADVTQLDGIDKNEVELLIKYEEYQGKRRMKVNVFAPGGGMFTMPKQMNDAEKRAFAQRMKGAAIASQAPNGTAPAQAQRRAPAAAGRDDSDIPF